MKDEDLPLPIDLTGTDLRHIMLLEQSGIIPEASLLVGIGLGSGNHQTPIHHTYTTDLSFEEMQNAGLDRTYFFDQAERADWQLDMPHPRFY